MSGQTQSTDRGEQAALAARHPGFLGIDPGLSGAIAFYRPTHPVAGMRLVVWPMPVTTKPGRVGAKPHRRIIPPDGVLNLLRIAHDSSSRLFCSIEDVHSSPQMGVAGAFSFGQGVGILHTALTSLEIPFSPVSPQVWKSATRTPKDKDLARLRASELFPDAHYLWTKRKDDGMAEAALLAWYAAKSA